MEDQKAATGSTSRAELCDEIGRAVGSLWQRRSGVKPVSVSTEYVGDVVRCVVEPSPDPAPDDGVGAEGIPVSAYDRGAQAAIASLTGRKVIGYVAKPVKTGAAAKSAFILEAARQKF